MKKDQVKILTKVVVIIFASIGSIFLFMMISDMIAWAQYLELLRTSFGIPYNVFYNDPQVSALIAEGYRILFFDKAVIFIPLFIIAIGVSIAGKKYVDSLVYVK